MTIHAPAAPSGAPWLAGSLLPGALMGISRVARMAEQCEDHVVEVDEHRTGWRLLATDAYDVWLT